MTIQLENGNTDPDEGIPLNTENGNGEQVYKTTTKQNSKRWDFKMNTTIKIKNRIRFVSWIKVHNVKKNVNKTQLFSVSCEKIKEKLIN